MAGKSMVLLSALIVAALGVAVAIAPSDKDVNTACGHVNEPKLCEEVVAKANPPTVHDLTVASIKEAMAKAENAHTVADRVITESTSPKLKTDLADCASVYEEAKSSLLNCTIKMEDKANYNKVVSEIESALTLIDACNDVFSAHPGEVDPIVQATSTLKAMVGDSLSLAVMIQKDPDEAPAAAPSSRKIMQ